MIVIDSDFPGGNVVVEMESIEGDTVRVRPDVRDTEGHWFYWYFRVRGAEGRTLRFAFEEDDVGVSGPGVSLDGGRTWRWLGAESGDERSFTYAFAEEVAEVRLSFGMPYTQANLDAFLSERAGGPHLRAGTLCESRKGRAVEALSFGKLTGEPEHRVLVTARHHACEMMASHALEGIVEGVLVDDEAGRWLREHVEFLAVPFMDKDGVEDGDQGKSRRPHDHNRDYAAPCIYPEVAALRGRARSWSEGRLRMAFDLHCPWIRGEWHEHVFFVGVPDEGLWSRAERFCDVLQRTATGPLPYRTSGNLPFGVAWNTPEEYGPRGGEPVDASDWFSTVPGIWFGATVELPYANVEGVAVTAETARAFGRDLARAMREHLAEQVG